MGVLEPATMVVVTTSATTEEGRSSSAAKERYMLLVGERSISLLSLTAGTFEVQLDRNSFDRSAAQVDNNLRNKERFMG